MLPYIVSKKKWVFKTFLTLIFAENLLNLIHLLLAKGPLSVASLFIGANTNFSESFEFLELKTSLYFLLLLPYIALFIFALRKTPQVEYARKSLIILLITFAYSTIYIGDNVVHSRFVRKALPITTKTIIEFYSEIKTYKTLKTRKIKHITANLNDNTDCRYVCILVLGESVNRNHLALYGYPRNTTPKLSARNDIFVYQDVISPYAHTLNSIFALYTDASLENKKTIDESISLLDIFSAAGFKTFWLSNQSPVGVYDNSIFNLAQTADNVKFVNKSSGSSFEAFLKKSYDELLLPELSKILANNDQNLFITIHLMGSHTVYSSRYPPKFEYFKNAANKKQKIIDNYDNSLIYTDFILDSMLNMLHKFSTNSNTIATLVYCADHGDNVFDYNNTAGRDASNYLPNCSVEIPFIIWLSDNYKKKYLNKITQIMINRHLPFSSDNLFHFIINLQNIETDYFIPQKSVINENYEIPQKRILEDGREY
jgi:heptose-I-phosphate ethanolaminephosphotransferase